MKTALLLLFISIGLVASSQNKTSKVNTQNNNNIIKIGFANYFDATEVPISVFDITDSLTAYLEKDNKKERLEVIKAEINFSMNGKANVIKLSYESKAKIKKEDLAILRKLPVGTKICIDQILLKYPNGSIVTATPIKFKLSKWQVLTN